MLTKLHPKRIRRRFSLRATFDEFSNRLGLVYFGYVSQRHDEHRLIRGITVSNTHRDNHYCIGSYDGYDVALVHRTDKLLLKPGGRAEPVGWVILAVDLTTKQPIPHLYIGHNKRRDVFYAKHTGMNEIPLGQFGQHNSHFTRQYTVYGSLTDAVEIERTFNPVLTNAILTYFDEYNIEIVDQVLYLSTISMHPGRATLDKLLQSGVWLARLIDTKANTKTDQ